MDSRKHLTDDERDVLETFLRMRLDRDVRNACMFLLALYSGARATELLSLRWDDLNLTTGEVHLATIKGGNLRTVVVPKWIREALSRLRSQSPDRPFALSYQRMAELWREYRTTPKPFHALRHTFAIRAYARTKDLRFVKYALGHASITNTMVYADYAYSSAEFRKMMRVR